MSRLCLAAALAAVSLAVSIPLRAEDAMDLGAVLDDPKTYQMRALVLRGTVADPRSETDPSGSFCRQVFRLEEGSRAIPVQFISPCEPRGGQALLKNGDRVVVEGQLDGKAPSGVVRVQASNVRPAGR